VLGGGEIVNHQGRDAAGSAVDGHPEARWVGHDRQPSRRDGSGSRRQIEMLSGLSARAKCQLSRALCSRGANRESMCAWVDRERCRRLTALLAVDQDVGACRL
jgi:hypothetical protein